MNKKNLTVFVVGLLIAAVAMVFFYNGNKSVTTDLKYAKTEMGPKDDPFARFEFERRMLVDPATGEIPESIRMKELEFASNLPTVESISLNKGNLATWTKRGPINRGGRTRALGIDIRTQTAPNITILAGGVSGGIFKSNDDGGTWANKLSPNVIHSVTCLAQDTRPGQENIWYAGTGESIGNSAGAHFSATFLGDGVFKSMDNGETWTLLPSTTSGTPQSWNSVWNYVNNINVNKSTGSIFAAASNVVMRSQDAGITWNMVRSTFTGRTMSDVQITTTGVIYAAIPFGETDDGISTSADDGATWTDITPGALTNYERIVMAIAPSNENILYVWAYTAGVGHTQTELWKYDASTTNWTNLTANLPATVPPVGGMNVQGSYDMVIKVRPDDANFVLIGGTNIYLSTDGFATQVTAAGWIGGYATANNISGYANHHPDQHSLAFLNSPNSNILYSGHDGGLSRTNDVTQSPVSWVNISRGYVTSQFYSLAIDPVTANDMVIAGGLQDNGNYTTFSGDFNTDWVDWNHGADGGYAEVRKISATDHTVYLEGQNGWLFRQQYSNGTLTADDFIQPQTGGPFAFVNPFVLDLNSNDIMYFAAGDRVLRSTDVSTAANWVTMNNASTGGSNVTALSISKTPANRLYVGGGNGELLKIDGANTGDPVPVNISAGLPNGYVICIYVDPANADNIIVVLSNYSVISLWSSINGGTNWTNISGNLEQNPDGSGNGPSCRWVSSVNANGTMKYFVATSTGLYSTTNLNGAATVWAQEGPNTIGNVVCTMVWGRDVDDYAVVGTHGMGVFSSTGATPVEDESTLLENYSLSQNYPNPFNPSTTIGFSVPVSGKVRLTLFDALGSVVGEIANKEFSAGNHSIDFNAANLTSGVYFYRIEAGSFVQSKKMILLR